MLRLLTWLAGALLLLAVIAGGLLLAGVDRQPLVDRSPTISPVAVAQARWLFKANDPRRLNPGDARQTAIPAALVDEGINYAATRFLGGRGALVLGAGQAEIRLTVPLPGHFFVNGTATVRTAHGKPELASARLGRVPLPPGLVDAALGAGAFALHDVRGLRPRRAYLIASPPLQGQHPNSSWIQACMSAHRQARACAHAAPRGSSVQLLPTEIVLGAGVPCL